MTEPVENADLSWEGALRHTDGGSGDPVVLIHGFSRIGHSWATQIGVLLQRGHRVITCERRYPAATGGGCDYQGFAADLHGLLELLDVRGATLVGFSMGPNEIIRYLATHGTGRIRRAMMFAPIRPFILDSTGDGDDDVFDGIVQAILADRPAFLRSFLDDFYDIDVRWLSSA